MEASAQAPEAVPPMAHESHADHHPSPLAYVKVAVILAVVTLIEVIVYYVSSLRHVIAPILLSLSLLKFVMVALYFMHLKFDSRMFRRVFVTGIVLATIVYFIVLSTFLFRR